MKILLQSLFAIALCCTFCARVAGQEAPKAAATPALFTIVKAEYGAETTWKDVAGILKDLVKDDKLQVKASNAIFGDPLDGVSKQLKVVVAYQGKNMAFVNSENTELMIDKATLDKRLEKLAK